MYASSIRRLRPVGVARPTPAWWTAMRARRAPQGLRPTRSDPAQVQAPSISEHEACVIGLASLLLAMVGLALLTLLLP
jgi:hypothetical protein